MGTSANVVYVRLINMNNVLVFALVKNLSLFKLSFYFMSICGVQDFNCFCCIKSSILSQIDISKRTISQMPKK